MRSFYLLIALVLLGSPLANAQNFSRPLAIPDTLAGPTFNLEIGTNTHEFFTGVATNCMGYNGMYLGPTLIMNKGDFNQMHVTNNLTDSTTTHWHGMHVAPEDDGGPHTVIPPDSTWSPDFEVLDDATTFWYHPHLHGTTTHQVYQGAAGLIILRDDVEGAMNLPRTYGVDDIPLIVQDKQFDTSGQLISTPFGDTMAINGVIYPYVEVPAQNVRFRILNASVFRAYNFGINDNRTFRQIGGDGGLLPMTFTTPRLLLVAGERGEIIVDFTGQEGDTIYLSSFAQEMPIGLPGGPGGKGGTAMGPSPLDSANFDFMRIIVGPPTSNPVTNIPNNLIQHDPWDESEADVYRIKPMEATADPDVFTIGGAVFDHHVINDTIWMGDIEVWELANTMEIAHSFHIHDIQFYVLDINGMPPAPPLRGKKDVVLIQPGDTLRWIGKFDDFADPHIPYMYHCHILPHEDDGMMGQFLVLDPDNRTESIPHSNLYMEVFPNPTAGLLKFKSQQPPTGLLTVMDVTGKQVMQHNLNNSTQVDLSQLPGGLYLIHLSDPYLGQHHFRVLKD